MGEKEGEEMENSGNFTIEGEKEENEYITDITLRAVDIDWTKSGIRSKNCRKTASREAGGSVRSPTGETNGSSTRLPSCQQTYCTVETGQVKTYLC